MLTQEQLAEIRQRVESQVDWIKVDLGDDNFPVEIHESPLYIGGLVCRFCSSPDNIVGNRDADSVLQGRGDVKALLEHVAHLEAERDVFVKTACGEYLKKIMRDVNIAIRGKSPHFGYQAMVIEGAIENTSAPSLADVLAKMPEVDEDKL